VDSQKAQAEIRQIELECRRWAVVRVDISATSFRRTDGPGYWILADVSLANTGSRDTRIKWDKTPAFFVRRASFEHENKGAPSFTEEIGMRPRLALNANSETISHVLRAGAFEHLAFAVQVAYPRRQPLSGSTDRFSESVYAIGVKLHRPSGTRHGYVKLFPIDLAE
jgi:hypothetical protein